MHRRALVMLNAALAAALLAGCGGSGDHNDADVAFAADLIPHHRQPVGMVDLTEQIEESQTAEIATMEELPQS